MASLKSYAELQVFSKVNISLSVNSVHAHILSSLDGRGSEILSPSQISSPLSVSLPASSSITSPKSYPYPSTLETFMYSAASSSPTESQLSSLAIPQSSSLPSSHARSSSPSFISFHHWASRQRSLYDFSISGYNICNFRCHDNPISDPNNRCIFNHMTIMLPLMLAPTRCNLASFC